MKVSLRVALIVLVLSFATSFPLSFGTPAAVAAESLADYTVLVYMNGSDLESGGGEGDPAGAATQDLQEMMEAGAGDRINVVVETGGTLQWAHPDISSEANQRWLVTPDGLEQVADDFGPLNMGESKTLTDFITWGVKNYPAKKYALVMWDHGGGAVSGFGVDEQFDGDALTLSEIQQALRVAKQQTNQTFEMIGFDACLMATVEVAVTLEPYARYMVASEEIEPGHGWEYTSILQAIDNRPAITGDQLGKVIVDSYRTHAAGDEIITLSVIDLQQINKVKGAFETFLKSLRVEDEKLLTRIAAARAQAEEYGVDLANGEYTDMIDLVDFVNHAKSEAPAQAGLVVDAVKRAVVYNMTAAYHPNSHGLSIYFPLRDRKDFAQNMQTYRTTGFSESYNNFLTKYLTGGVGEGSGVRFANDEPVYDEEQDIYSVQVNLSDVDRIEKATSVLGTYREGSDQVIYLGYDNNVVLDRETGVLYDQWTGMWPTLNGEFVPFYFVNEDEKQSQYIIPVRLNGEKANLLVVFTEDGGKVVGAWKGLSDGANMPDKNIMKIKRGDRIVPLFETEDLNTGKTGVFEGAEIKVGGELIVDEAELPAGEYLYGFYVRDYAQHESYSQLVDFVIDPTDETPVDPNQIRVTIDGKVQTFEQPPVLLNGRTMLPLRAIFESLGAEVAWDGRTQTITAFKDDHVIVLKIGQSLATVDGEPATMDQPAQIVNDRTMVPVRFVSEALGAAVGWDANSRTVIIETKE